MENNSPVGCWIFSILLVLVAISTYNYVRSLHKKEKKDADIVIGILSARNHFDLRKAQRETWLHHDYPTLSKRFLHKFIIGRKGCDIHVADRKNKFSCEWDPLIISYQDEEILAYNVNTINNTQTIREPVGLDFEVNHAIVITKLALVAPRRDKDVFGQVKVSIYDRIKKEEVVSAEFHSNEINNETQIFIFKTIKAIMLPKEFKGTFIVDSNNDELAVVETIGPCLINDGGGLLSFEKVTRSGILPGIFPDDITSRNSFCHFLAGSFTYKAFDAEHYESITERVKKRRLQYELQKIESKKETDLLNKESERFGDIEFVDVVDHYQNLPRKLLLFYKWVINNHNFKFTIKTDDDCFLNIPGIFKGIDEYKLKATDNIWYSNFRSNWPLDKFGKWAEHDFTAPVYPAFACGSGNLLSRSLVEWIANNSRYLHAYQGEDVSVGIWLSAVAPKLFKDRKWSCIKSCERDILSLPDNNSSELFSLFNNSITCGNPCSC